MNRRNDYPRFGCAPIFALLFLIILFYFFGPLVQLILRLVMRFPLWAPLLVSLPLIVLALIALLIRTIPRKIYGKPLSYDKALEMVRSTGRRYAKMQGLVLSEEELRTVEAPGYTMDDYIDRAGISPVMEYELRREFRRAFR